MDQLLAFNECCSSITMAVHDLRTYKPNDRSPHDRAYAVAITELEKALAYFMLFANPNTDHGDVGGKK